MTSRVSLRRRFRVRHRAHFLGMIEEAEKFADEDR